MEKLENLTKNKDKKTFGELWNSFNTSIMFPAFAAVARATPLAFFNGYENGPKALFNYCLAASLVDIAEVAYRVYGKNELGPIPSLDADSETMKKAQAEWDANAEEHMSWAKPYSCFEKHIFYDLPKKIYNSIKKQT